MASSRQECNLWLLVVFAHPAMPCLDMACNRVAHEDISGLLGCLTLLERWGKPCVIGALSGPAEVPPNAEIPVAWALLHCVLLSIAAYPHASPPPPNLWPYRTSRALQGRGHCNFSLGGIAWYSGAYRGIVAHYIAYGRHSLTIKPFLLQSRSQDEDNRGCLKSLQGASSRCYNLKSQASECQTWTRSLEKIHKEMALLPPCICICIDSAWS